MSEAQPDDSNVSEILENTSPELVSDIIKQAHQYVQENLEDISDLEIKIYFPVGQDWRFYDDLKEKILYFSFIPSSETKRVWLDVGFKKLPHLLNFLKKKYKGLEKFDIIFFNQPKSEPYYYMKAPSGLMIFYINIEKYLEYGEEINPEINKLKVTKYAREIQSVFSNKVPIAFFNKTPPHELTAELKNSYYKILENIIGEFENLSPEQQEEVKNFLANTKLGIDTIKKYVKLNPKAPEKQLNLFLQVIDKLGEQDVEILLKAILRSKISKYFIQKIMNLPSKDRSKIVNKMPEMIKMHDRYMGLEKSLKNFRKKISEHVNSSTQNEKDIHKFISKHYWLLGIEYFDSEINSDFDRNGGRTSSTRIGRKHADFIIKKLDGLDKCIVIELEEANDRIFNIDGTLSADVFDGINQAIDYNIEQRLRGFNSKGLAVIGSVQGLTLSEEHKKRLSSLIDHYHNIEILTYEDIIQKAESTLKFWKEYENSKTM